MENPRKEEPAASAPGLGVEEADARSQAELLAVGKRWQEQGKVHHAVGAFSQVIQFDPGGKPARLAREALVGVAEKWRRQGREYAAANLYHLLAKYSP